MKKLGLIFLLLITTYVYPQNFGTTEIDKDIISTLFNGDWQKSDSLIDAQLTAMPNHPKYYFIKAYNAFYSRIIGNNGLSRDESIRKTTYYAWEAVKIGEQITPTTETKFYTGLAYAFLSRINIMNREFWTAYWNAGESEDLLEEVLEEDPRMVDAYFNLGVTDYFAGAMVTGFRGALAWLGGMSGDRERGLYYIDLVAEKGNLFKDEAKFAIGIIYRFREVDNAKAIANLSELYEKYPGSAAISNAYTTASFVDRIDKEGVDFLEAEFDSLATSYNITNSFVLNGIGYNLINQNKLNEALKVFQTNIRLYPTVANCYDSLAECYMNMGDNANAIKFYQTAYEKLDTDDSITDENREASKVRITEQLEELDAGINT